MGRRLWTAGLAALLVGAIFLVPSVAAAEEGISAEPEKPNKLSSFALELFKPFKDVLSGPVWLIANGVNPFQGDLIGADTRLHLAGPRLVGPLAPSAQGGAGALVPYRDPSAKFSRNILIPRDFSNAPLQTEPHVAVNPKDPDHILVGMIDYNFPAVTAYVTIDGGVTWEGPFQIKHPREELASAGDPVVVFDRNGNAFFAFISLDVEDFQLGNILGSAVVSSISVSASTDGGFTWSSGVSSARSSVETALSSQEVSGLPRGELTFSFLDKPWMTIGPHPKDSTREVLYVTYTKFIARFGIGYAGELPFLTSPVEEVVIELVRSEDGGITWTDPIEVSPRVRSAFEGGRLQQRVVQGSQPAVAPDGTVYVAWMDSTDDGPFEGLAQIFVARSEDAGEEFSPPRRAATFNETGFSPRTTFFRYWGSSFPQLTVGPKGEVYVAFIGLPSGNVEDDGDLFVARSVDKGQTWERVGPLNDDKTSRLQFFPSITTSPDGAVHAMWGDMRDDPNETKYHIYYAKSEDQGKTWGLNARVTDSYSNPNYGFPGGQFIGDYFSIKATMEDVYMVWADTRLGEFQGTNQKIGFARQRQIAKPSIFLNPGQGAGGRDVTIQGFNFQPNQTLFIQVGGSLVAQERAGPEGTFTTRLFIPIAGEGPHDVVVLDASGNVAPATFFMDFGFDNIRKTSEMVDSISGRLNTVEGSLTATSQAIAAAAQAIPVQVGQQVNKEITAQVGSLGTELAALRASVAAVGEAQAAATTEARSRDQRVFLVAILAAVAAGLALVVAGVAAARLGRRRWEPR